jgi:hypothetical protein
MQHSKELQALRDDIVRIDRPAAQVGAATRPDVPQLT